MLKLNKMLLYVTIILFTGCATMLAPRLGKPINQDELRDGIYEGIYSWGPNKVKVKVSIERNKIVDIEILKHRAWKGKKAEQPIVKRIIEKQSTEVDAVSGATNSSHVIMNAVQEAISKAYKNNDSKKTD